MHVDDIGCRQLENLGAPELAQALHLLLQVIFIDLRHQPVQLGRHLFAVILPEQLLRIEQLVQQDRVARQFLCEPVTGCTQLEHLLLCDWDTRAAG